MEVKIPYSQKEIDKLYKLQEKMTLDYLKKGHGFIQFTGKANYASFANSEKLNHNELKKQII